MNDNKILEPIGVRLFGIGIGRKNRLSIRKAVGYLEICPIVFCIKEIEFQLKSELHKFVNGQYLKWTWMDWQLFKN